VTTFEDDIKKCERAIDEYNDKIEDMNNEMAKALDVFERLYNARAGSREYFDKAKDQLKDVRSDPAKYLGGSPSDDDIKKLQEYLRVIEGEIEDNERNHREQEDSAKEQIEKFRELIKKTNCESLLTYRLIELFFPNETNMISRKVNSVILMKSEDD
jgi:chromosome segregation ATPase